jgi:hypothetical protein
LVGLRSTPSGHLITQGTDFSLKIVDTKLEIKHKFKSPISNNVKHHSKKYYLQSNFSFEGSKTLWFNTPNTVSIVDLRTLEMTLVKDIIPTLEGSPPQPISVIADLDKEKILILCELEGEKVFSYYEPSLIRPTIRLIEDQFPSVCDVSSLNLSCNKLLVYLGCSKRF